MSHWEKEQERLLKLWEAVGAEDSENEQLEQEAASGSEAEENNSERSTNSDTEQEIGRYTSPVRGYNVHIK
ncbi:unnamed protein product [Acanthoscelides obtectus]|uniref:Uncharacterized protein n=1 Tax=Acanthoscelides obtectus TaxID=200917 RepID=A0A9P0QIX2_ACAOB|nr:unnamed protein product [Acanthoscelides obtectus]CAH2021161.1 unnamed protein product [Acanthoscelides obtectus]CAK1641436.1 hypothetical protein AOBTE_LOCUS12402 [Acanthoscelides obtectus]CAK1685108.1 hypothetical protein AOBTE_LOCUS35232 [Acanthoscelides obtectus]